ncbi:hypothetical protein CKO31_17895, partial [Thiohalocapsa halophila]
FGQQGKLNGAWHGGLQSRIYLSSNAAIIAQIQTVEGGMSGVLHWALMLGALALGIWLAGEVAGVWQRTWMR